jgi:hypothetical protein
VQSALRHIAFHDREIEAVEHMVAKQMLNWPQARRLMTVPGVNLIGTPDVPGRDRRHHPVFKFAAAGRLSWP